MPEPLIYIEVGGRRQCLNKLTEDRKAEVLAGVVERIHELTPDGAITEDEATGKVHVNGRRDDTRPADHLAKLREKHPPKPPQSEHKPPKAQGKGGK